MGSAIVSANVGGIAAGNVVLPEPVYPGYATWPDISPKDFPEIVRIWGQRLIERGKDPDDPDDSGAIGSNAGAAPRVNGSGSANWSSIFSFPVIALIVLFILFVRS